MELPKWHRLSLPCPTCSKEATIVSLFASSDGQIALDLVCIFCGKALNFTTTGANLVRNATLTDIEEAKPKPTTSKRLQPPLKQGVTQSEKIWLHTCGIDWKDKGENKWQ